MKRLYGLLALGILLNAAALAQEATPGQPAPAPGPGSGTNQPLHLRAVEAKRHIGARAVVTGKVAEVNRGAAVVRLNFDEPFPKETFTAIIFSRDTNHFTNLDALKDKTVEVKGKITLYRGRPELQLQNTNQLRVLAETAPGTNP